MEGQSETPTYIHIAKWKKERERKWTRFSMLTDGSHFSKAKSEWENEECILNRMQICIPNTTHFPFVLQNAVKCMSVLHCPRLWSSDVTMVHSCTSPAHTNTSANGQHQFLSLSWVTFLFWVSHPWGPWPNGKRGQEEITFRGNVGSNREMENWLEMELEPWIGFDPFGQRNCYLHWNLKIF